MVLVVAVVVAAAVRLGGLSALNADLRIASTPRRITTKGSPY
jgi:hypothetical protein